MTILETLRTSLHFSTTEMAEALGVTRQAIEQAERLNSCSKRLALAAVDKFRPQMIALGLTVEDLIRGSRGIVRLPRAGEGTARRRA